MAPKTNKNVAKAMAFQGTLIGRDFAFFDKRIRLEPYHRRRLRRRRFCLNQKGQKFRFRAIIEILKDGETMQDFFLHKTLYKTAVCPESSECLIKCQEQDAGKAKRRIKKKESGHKGSMSDCL
uniref:Uncharacterized protein n=1 Tax=Romanomermis culicivorax TaxID=13658 RepID=A0A915J980_ROMCU